MIFISNAHRHQSMSLICMISNQILHQTHLFDDFITLQTMYIRISCTFVSICKYQIVCQTLFTKQHKEKIDQNAFESQVWNKKMTKFLHI